jgi:ribonucleoside-triphosphate reductase (thioredoxin)
MTIKLNADFLKQYPDFPEHMAEVGKFTFYRTYSRYLPEKGRRETWKEVCKRAVEFNINLEVKHSKKHGLIYSKERLQTEAKSLFHNMFNLKQFLSGRTLWVGGAETGVGEKYPMSNFNCAFINIEKYSDFAEMFYLLMVGTGVGFKSTPEMTAKMSALRTDVVIEHAPYHQLYPYEKDANTAFYGSANGMHLIVGDSKEGWTNALKWFFEFLTNQSLPKHLTITYDYVRPRGTRLKTFGGTASGHEPLKEMFEGIEKVIHGKLDPGLKPPEQAGDNLVKLRPVHMLDIGNLLGANVVVGGVRRTAEIFLFSADDYESMLAKYGINGFWKEEDFIQHEELMKFLEKEGVEIPHTIKKMGERQYDEQVNGGQPFHFGTGMEHRRMSNNTIAFTDKPRKEVLDFVFKLMRLEGEPGFLNLRQAAIRRLKGRGITLPTEEMVEQEMKVIGINPCAEILLHSRGLCNLTTVNMAAFVNNEGVLDLTDLGEAQKLSARAGMRMALAEMELPEWDKVQKRDRLVGTSLTGVMDAMGRITAVKNIIGTRKVSLQELELLLSKLRHVANIEVTDYSKQLRVPKPLLATTVKPEGTLSQLAGGVSNGLHYSHAPYYIRRIRINADDPLAKSMIAQGYEVHADVGTKGFKTMQELATPEAIAAARSLVLSFPVKSAAKVTKNDVDVKKQLDNYFTFQTHYTDHNSSNTIHITNTEWDYTARRIHTNWDEFIAVSFMPHDGGNYLLAPYEEITKAQYEEMVKNTPKFDPDVLKQFETGEDFDLDQNGCDTGACPIR